MIIKLFSGEVPKKQYRKEFNIYLVGETLGSSTFKLFIKILLAEIFETVN